MDKLRTLSKGAQVTLGASVLLLIDSFFNWFDYHGFGWNMWTGVGVIAAIVLLALIVWLVLPLANINLELGISNSMITAGLSVVLLLFVLIRVLSKPYGADAVSRTIWAWIGLLLAVAIVAGAWMTMQAAGESLSDVKAKVSSMTASAGGSSADASTTTPPPPAPEAPAAPAPPADEPASEGS